MSLSVAVGAALQLVGFVLVGYVTGQWLLDLRKRGRAPLEWPERWLMAVVGGVVFCVVAMVANLVTGGAVFGSPFPVPALAIAVLVLRWRSTPRPADVPWKKVGAAAAALILLFALPVFISGTALRRGDLLWHMGWSEQLLAGEAVPEGPAPDDVAENAYPWGFHAAIATLVRIVPGTDVTTTLVTLHLLFLLGIPLAGACVARTVRARYGWAAAAATSLIGGFGWILARGIDFVPDPDSARYGADLVIASPNAVYELFPPPLPRELGLVLLAAAAVLLGRALRNEGSRIGAGITLGVTGLVSAPALVGGVVWMLGVLMAKHDRVTTRALGVMGAATAAVFALWAGPVAANAIAHGGFVNITPELGREWAAWTALGSWGLLLPLALGGLVVCATEERRRARFLIALTAGTAVWLGLAMLRGALEWTLAGNATLLHQGRVWPVAHLLGGALAGMALVAGFRRLRARSRAAGAAAAVVVIALGAISPVIASLAITRAARDATDGFYYSQPEYARDGFLRQAAAHLGPEDSVSVPGGRPLAFLLFSYSGVRLARYDDPRLDGNDLRVRYRDLAARWDARIAADGYEPDFVVLRAELAGDIDAIERGTYRNQDWVLLRAEDAPDAS